MLHIRALASKAFFLGLSVMAGIVYSPSLDEKALAHPPITLTSSTSHANGDPVGQLTQIYDFTMDDIDGNPRELRELRVFVETRRNMPVYKRCMNDTVSKGLRS